jgi:hypothetical protein
VRQRVGGISRLRRVRIDIDSCSKDNVAQVERLTRLRTKRGNRQAGWQLVARLTRLRTKRGNCQAGLAVDEEAYAVKN